MSLLVVAVAYFAAAWLGKKVKLEALAKYVAKVSRKMFEVPEFSIMLLQTVLDGYLYGTENGAQSRAKTRSEVIYKWNLSCYQDDGCYKEA